MIHLKYWIRSLSLQNRQQRGPLAIGSAILTAMLMAVMFVPVAQAQRTSTKLEVENLRVGFDASASSLQASDTFKIGTWTPVWVQLRAGSEPFRGFMDVIVADDDATPTSFRLAVDMPANQSQRFTAYARPGSRQPEFTVRLVDQDGRRVGGASQATVMPRPPESIMPDETVLLTMGRPMGVETIAELPGFRGVSRNQNRGSVSAEIVTARIDTQTGFMPAAGMATTRLGPSSSTPETKKPWLRWTHCAVRDW